MSHDNNNKDLNTSLTDDEVSKIVNSERLQQAIKDTHDAWEKTKFKWQIFVALIMAFSAAFGYYLKWDSDRKDRIEQQIQVDNERKAEEIQALINQKMGWMRRADLAVMNMRKTREIIIIKCQNNILENNYQNELQRFIARDETVRAFDGIDFIFNDAVREKARQLIKFDENIKNVCSKNSPDDTYWYQYATDIKELMGQSIRDDQYHLLQITKNHN